MTLSFYFNRLFIGALDFMKNRENIEDLITDSLTLILKRSLTLEKNDKLAIYQEFKEWLNGITKDEDIWLINDPIK